MKSHDLIINGTYFVVQSFMVKRLNLKGNELLVYAIIYGYSQNSKNSFSGSLTLLEQWTNTSRPAVVDALKGLVNKKLVYKKKTKIPCSFAYSVSYYALAYEDRTFTDKDFENGLVQTQINKNEEGGSENEI